MEDAYMEKASSGLSLLPPEIRTRTKDDEDEGDNDAPCRGRQKNGVTIQYSTLVTTADLTPLQGESI